MRPDWRKEKGKKTTTRAQGRGTTNKTVHRPRSRPGSWNETIADMKDKEKKDNNQTDRDAREQITINKEKKRCRKKKKRIEKEKTKKWYEKK